MQYAIVLCLLAWDAGQEQLRAENDVLVEIYETKRLHHGVIVQRALVTHRYNQVRADRLRKLYATGACSRREAEDAVLLADTSACDYQRAILSEREAGLRLKHVRLLAASGKRVPLPDTDDESLDRDEGPPK